MSECDADCRLCGPLGCLRPHRITSPEFLHELDRAAQRCASTVVFPPNFLNHPEAAQFCFETSRRGLTPLVRLRPAQLVSMSELLSTLEYRGAKFEVVVAEAIPAAALESRLDFKTVFIPSTLHDPALLFDSIPFTWRRGLKVLAPFASTFEHALSVDELYLFAQERKLKVDPALARETLGKIPSARETHVRMTGFADDIRYSVILAARSEADLARTLEALESQSMESKFFEVIVACDRVSDEFIESIKTKANMQILRLPECWGEPSFRQAQAFNLAAASARGSRLLFLSEAFPVERDLLTRCARRTDAFVKLDSRSHDKPARCAHLMTLKHYFESGGYPESEHNGFEFDLAERKSQPTLWVLGETDKAETPVPALTPKASSQRAKAAQDVFLMTLDREFYRAHFAMMGSRPMLRRFFMWFGFLNPLRDFLAKIRMRAEISRAAKALKAVKA